MRLLAPLALSVCVVGLGACSGMSDNTREIIANVKSLRFGSMNQLRERRDTGPFRTYAVAPQAMLKVLERAARNARGEGGLPVRAIFVSTRRLEVVAKEREPELAEQTGYAEQFVSAMLAVVHPVEGEPGKCRVEIHAIRGGPLHRGVVHWEQDMPRWIDEVLREPPPAADAGEDAQ